MKSARKKHHHSNNSQSVSTAGLFERSVVRPITPKPQVPTLDSIDMGVSFTPIESSFESDENEKKFIELLDTEEIEFVEGVKNDDGRIIEAKKIATYIIRNPDLSKNDKFYLLHIATKHTVFQYRNSPNKKNPPSPRPFFQSTAQAVLVEAMRQLEDTPDIKYFDISKIKHLF